MSYDIWLEVDTGGPSPLTVESWNYTSNCGPMFRQALGNDGLCGLAGKPAGDVLVSLETAIGAMVENPEVYRAMNPPNGWGSYEGAIEFLRAMHEGFRQHPKAIVAVWN